MGLREGKNREIKRVLEHLGLSVNRLIRVSFGPFELGDLAEGEVEETRTRVLRDQLGPKLAREAGVDFDAPVLVRAQPAPPPREERRRPRGERQGLQPRSRMPPPREERAEIAPRGRAPAPSHPQRKRKHVAKLRAEIAAEAEGPRKRIERSATSDRKGRVVAVERILPSREEQRRRDEAGQKAAPRRGRRGAGEAEGRGGERSARRPDFSPRGAGDEARPPRSFGKRFDKSALARGAEKPPREGSRRPSARRGAGRPRARPPRRQVRRKVSRQARRLSPAAASVRRCESSPGG